jgi:hypothetical protein
MQAQVAYDILAEGWPVGPFLLHLSIVGIALIFIRAYLCSRKTGSPVTPGAALVGALVLLVGFLAFFGVYLERYKCRKWARTANYSIVEGAVEDFHPEPEGGHGPETFRVGDVFFACSSNNLDRGGFKRTARGGSPIRPGLHVRICHHNGRILRLEILQTPNQAAGLLF